MYRQGDVLFVAINDIPAKVGEWTKKNVLVEGEATGHHHAVAPIDMESVEFFIDKDGRCIMQNKKPVNITHQEHHTINLPAGAWEIRRQVEYFPEGWKQVRD